MRVASLQNLMVAGSGTVKYPAAAMETPNSHCSCLSGFTAFSFLRA